MSVDNYSYKCFQCGHVENQCEGIYLMSDKCYTLLQCPQCKVVSSIQLSESAIRAENYPLCPDCNMNIVKWDKTCAEYGAIMNITEWITDTI